MFNADLGHTYQADRLNDNGEAIVSSLDHAYISSTLEEYTTTCKLTKSSTDHVPIITKLKQAKNDSQCYIKTVPKVFPIS